MEWINTYDAIEETKSVLIVGGGVVATKLAAELACKYGVTGEKRIGMCVRGDKILSNFNPRISQCAERFLKSVGVEINFNTPFHEENPKALGYDYVIKCIGLKFRTDYMKLNFPQALSPRGQIYVNDLMQISGVDPRKNPYAPALKENIFCLGDCCLTSLNEEKTIATLCYLSEYVRKNIMQHAAGQRPSHQLPKAIPTYALITLGPTFGILQINGVIKMGEGVGDSIFTSAEFHSKMNKGDLTAFVKARLKIVRNARILDCLSSCCCCCPCSNTNSMNRKTPMSKRTTPL